MIVSVYNWKGESKKGGARNGLRTITYPPASYDPSIRGGEGGCDAKGQKWGKRREVF